VRGRWATLDVQRVRSPPMIVATTATAVRRSVKPRVLLARGVVVCMGEPQNIFPDPAREDLLA
jgi:hypothetical protein